MNTPLDPFSFVVTTIAGWINRDQQQVIEYLTEENRVLREQIGSRRLRFSDDQRRRLATKAKKLGRSLRLLHYRSVDLRGHETICHSVLHGAVNATRGDRRNRKQSERAMDDADCTQYDG